MTLKELEAVYWAGTLGSFALAAERLSMTQSSLSKRILELEQELGEKLFDRSGPRARITCTGARVLVQAQQMLALRDAIVMDLRGPRALRGTCRFGVSEVVASTWLPALVREVRRVLPEVALEPRAGVTQELLAAVSRGDTDFAIGPGGSVDADIQSRALHSVPLIWVCSPQLPEARRTLTAELLARVPVVSTSAQAGATTALDTWAASRGLKYRRIVVSNSTGAVAALAAAGLGLCLLPEPYAQPYIRARRLRRMACGDSFRVPPLPYYLHWRRGDEHALPSAVREIVVAVGTEPCWTS